jgi:hypothetical protein
MKVEELSMDKKQAHDLWVEYRELCKEKRKDVPYADDMKKLYNCLKSGRKVIDIYEAFKKCGLNSKNEPKLAIARATWKRVVFKKGSRGNGYFNNQTGWSAKSIYLPPDTYHVFPFINEQRWNILDIEIQTKVPIIPAKFIPEANLENYHILWEVEKWERIPKDPMLLKQITKNLFVVCAVWDLTPLERALIRGR